MLTEVPMQPISSHSNLNSCINIFKLIEGVEVYDKANGIAKVKFAEVESYQRGEPCYNLYIGEKKVYDFLGKNLLFRSSLAIKLKQVNNFIKITEIDSKKTKTFMYADTLGKSFIYSNSDTGSHEKIEIVSLISYMPKKKTSTEEKIGH
jgi:hypothetical protein